MTKGARKSSFVAMQRYYIACIKTSTRPALTPFTQCNRTLIFVDVFDFKICNKNLEKQIYSFLRFVVFYAIIIAKQQWRLLCIAKNVERN